MYRSLLLSAIVPLAFASSNLQPHSNILRPRQESEAFRPDTSRTTTSCANPCGDELCIFPSRGDTCCAPNYGCPGGNFCLTQGLCCPDGLDPATCARQNGITLPEGFQPGQTVGAGSSASSAEAAPQPSAPIEVSSEIVPTPPPPPPPASTPVYEAGNTTTAVPTGSGAGNPGLPTNTNVPFTGGAAGHTAGGIIGAVVFGFVGLFL